MFRLSFSMRTFTQTSKQNDLSKLNNDESAEDWNNRMFPTSDLCFNTNTTCLIKYFLLRQSFFYYNIDDCASRITWCEISILFVLSHVFHKIQRHVDVHRLSWTHFLVLTAFLWLSRCEDLITEQHHLIKITAQLSALVLTPLFIGSCLININQVILTATRTLLR